MKELRGVFTVMITPFTPDDKIDEVGLRANIDWYIKEGIHGVDCTGSTGEFIALSEEERKRVVDITIEQVNGRVPVIVGTAGDSTKDTIKWTKYAKDSGADAAMIVNPYYHMPDENELYEHYKAIAKAVDIPIMIYNNKWTTGVDASAELIARLSEIDNILYVKESSADVRRVHDIIMLAGEKITVFCGWEDIALESFILGAKGWISATANIIPKMCVNLFESVEKGDISEAKKLYYKALPFFEAIENWGKFVQVTKRGMDLIGRTGGQSRAPKLPLTKEQDEKLKKIFRDLNLI
jgi:4-hydroxy-tetrahydrodipicolinate synthase